MRQDSTSPHCHTEASPAAAGGVTAPRALGPILAGLLLAGLGYALGMVQEDDDDGGGPPQTQIIPSLSAGSTSDSNNRMIAVTGMDVTGTSVLYLVDTVGGQLAVYQANGGSAGTQGIKLVGARRIDLDLQLHGFNDRTEHEGRPLRYADLAERFRTQGLISDGDE